MHTEAKAGTEGMARVFEAVRFELRANAVRHRCGITIGEETKALAQKATKKSRVVMEKMVDMKDKALLVRVNDQMNHNLTVMAASGMLASETHEQY